METSELLKKVRKIEIKTKGLSKHIFSGEYHSAFKGRGMSFSEVRGYQFGDDVRNIDWNVTARTGDPHVKVFEEERELTVMLLVDVSRSAYFGTVNQFKSDLITEVCALLSFSAINNNDKVGVLFFTSEVELFIPPKKGRQHILRIIRELINFKPQHTGTDIGKAVDYFNSLIKKRSICFLLSDFLAESYETPLRLAARRHDLIGIKLVDPKEEKLPDVGLIRVEDAETGRLSWLDTSSRKIRRQYEQWYNQKQNYFREVFVKNAIDTMTLRTNEPYLNVLHNFFQKRSG